MQSPFCRDESRPDKLWRSELESNQPFGLFRPALIHLSYPTLKIYIETFDRIYVIFHDEQDPVNHVNPVILSKVFNASIR